MKNIIIKEAREGNLKNISLGIPRDKLVILTGISGSGKSTLAMDVLFGECQRQYLEAMGMQGIRKPDVEYIRNLSPAILITQNDQGKNPRSSVGTATDIYTDLRMIYEKLGKRTCPDCEREIYSNECKEETEKTPEGFKVYMYCSHCGHKMDKLTRTHFSYNTREGACPNCDGLGEALNLDIKKLADENLSLEEGAVEFWTGGFKQYQIDCIKKTFQVYGLEYVDNQKIKDYSEKQMTLLLYGTDSPVTKEMFKDIKPPKAVMDGKYEGIATVVWRRVADKGTDSKEAKKYFSISVCEECNGERLNKLSRNVTILNRRLPELVNLSLDELNDFIEEIDSMEDERARKLVELYILDLKTKINRIIKVGLGYLNIDRQMMTLSGGESQRIKLSAMLDSDMTGLIYILDEPTASLHPKDTEGIIQVLKDLRDKGNSMIVIEHDVDVMKKADYIVDIGPGAGKHGGEIVGQGTLEEILENSNSVTGVYLKNQDDKVKEYRRHNDGYIQIKNAHLYNLKNIDADIPMGVMTAVTGVSGSGKSTLIFEILAKDENKTAGLDKFDEIVIIDQTPITRMKRSNVATYSDLYTEIRNIFGGISENLNSSHFSFNTKGGRCDNCEGLGYVSSNMLFFQDIEVVCPVCGGSRFKEEILQVEYKGKNINDILNMSVEDAAEIFKDNKKISAIISILLEVGLGYLDLGQTLTTLSGGEGQRLKLAKELTGSKGKENLYLLDEPTRGLHPIDVENFLILLNKLVDNGNTVILIEHNQQVINSCDWIIDMGPEGGVNGGNIISTGTSDQIKNDEKSVTGKFL